MGKLAASYDRFADVLYLNVGKPRPIEGDGLPRGVELDFALDSGKPCGITVVGFKRNGWLLTRAELAEIASRHLSVSTSIARNVIEATVGEDA